MLEKICKKLDETNFLHITRKQEKIMQWLSIPAIAAAICLVFSMAPANAAEIDLSSPRYDDAARLSEYFGVLELKPILATKYDKAGRQYFTVDEVEMLVQLPGQKVARRMRAGLGNTLFLDQNAPLPGQKTYDAVIGLDGLPEAPQGQR